MRDDRPPTPSNARAEGEDGYLPLGLPLDPLAWTGREVLLERVEALEPIGGEVVGVRATAEGVPLLLELRVVHHYSGSPSVAVYGHVVIPWHAVLEVAPVLP